MRVRLVLALLVVTAVSSAGAQAGPIVVRPLDFTRIGEYSNLAPTGTHQQVADRFVLADAATVESLTWFGRYDTTTIPANPIAFSVRIFLDDLGKPFSTPAWTINQSVTASLQGTSYSGAPWFTYSLALPGWTLGPGTYWLSIVENDAATPPVGSNQWLWADTSGSGLRAIRNGDGISWGSGTDWPHAFTLEGTVPDAGSTLLLFGMAIVALRACRRR